MTMQATSKSSLHDLPLEVLRLVAVLIRDQPCQQALRSSSRTLRDALNLRIQACNIRVTYSEAQKCHHNDWAGRVQAGVAALARFPAACTLTSLSWKLDDWHSRMRTYYDCDPRDVLAGSILCQQVLTGFIAAAGTRLSTVQRLHISTAYAVGYGEVLSITLACPALKHLKLSKCTLVGFVFAPLARLTSFSSLDIDDTSADDYESHDWHPFSESLAHLGSSLTQLTFMPKTTYGFDDARAITCIQGLQLTALRKLKFKYRRYYNKNSSLGMLSALPHLTELDATHLDIPPDCPPLACASSLTSLTLGATTLGSHAIRMLAAMPVLSELHVHAFEPDCDLSDLQCGWKQVRIGSNTHPRQLAWLPLAGVERVDIQPSWKLCADLKRTTDDLGDQVRRACLLLAKVGNMRRLTVLDTEDDDVDAVETPGGSDEAPGGTVSLSWGEPPEPALSEAQHLAVLEALWPLRHVALGLSLDAHWYYGAEEAKALAQALPRLHTLQLKYITGSRPFHFFTTLTQQGLSGLRRLIVWHVATDRPVTLADSHSGEDFEGALLALAKDSLLKGRALRVSLCGLPKGTRERLNNALSEAWQEAGLQGALAQVVFESMAVPRPRHF